MTSATSIRVEWTAPADNGCAITDYDLRYRIRHDPGDAPNEWISYLLSDDTWLPVNSEDNGFETALSMLPNAIHYEVQVRAENRSGESDWSPSGYIENTPPRITIVSDVSVIALSGSNSLPTEAMITVTIEDDEDDITDLILAFNTMELTGTGTNRTFPHPSTNADYEIQATVEDSGGLTASASVVISAIDVPDAPNRPEVTLNDLSSIEVRWSEPESNNSDITDYDVRYKLISDREERYEEWLPTETFSDRRALITGLGLNAANYHVQVRAYNEAGESDWSESASPNGPPVITEFTGQILGDPDATPTSSDTITINKDQEVNLVVTAHDTDNPPDPLMYNIEVTHIDGVAVDMTEDNGGFRDTSLSFQEIFVPPEHRRNVTFTIKATVSDGLSEDGGFTVDTFEDGTPATIDITVENRLPIVTVEVVEDMIHTGGNTDVTGNITELDGDSISFVWIVRRYK